MFRKKKFRLPIGTGSLNVQLYCDFVCNEGVLNGVAAVTAGITVELIHAHNTSPPLDGLSVA